MMDDRGWREKETRERKATNSRTAHMIAGSIVERNIGFLFKDGHTGEQIADLVNLIAKRIEKDIYVDG